MPVQKTTQNKLLSENRKARHDYHLLESYEAGLSLTGTEVKAARAGKVQLREAYARISNGEAWLVNAHISEYSHGNIMNHMPGRDRKLLLHRAEIRKLQESTREKGLSLIPTKLYLKNGKVKIEICVAKGKQLHDKRETERNKTAEQEARQAIRAVRDKYR